MTQEEKQLLLKDLFARVFYGVKVNIEKDYPNNPQVVERVAKDGEIIVDGIRAYDIYYYKPYLRLMSSMTEEERKEVEELITAHRPSPDGIINNKGMDNLLFSVSITSGYLIDWLNKNMFDYRGLISIELALEAPEGMYES